MGANLKGVLLVFGMMNESKKAGYEGKFSYQC